MAPEADPARPPAWQVPAAQPWGAPPAPPAPPSTYAINVSGSTIGAFSTGHGATASGSVASKPQDGGADGLVRRALDVTLPGLVDNAGSYDDWAPIFKASLGERIHWLVIERLMAELKQRNIRAATNPPGVSAVVADASTILYVNMQDAILHVRGQGTPISFPRVGVTRYEPADGEDVRAVLEKTVPDILANASTRGQWAVICGGSEGYTRKTNMTEAMTRRGIRTSMENYGPVRASVPDLVNWDASGRPATVGFVVECGGTVFRCRLRGTEVDQFGDKGWTTVDRSDPLCARVFAMKGVPVSPPYP